MEFWGGKDLKGHLIPTPSLEQVCCAITQTLLTHNSHLSNQLQKKTNGKKAPKPRWKEAAAAPGLSLSTVPQQNSCTNPFLATFKQVEQANPCLPLTLFQ